MKKEKTKAKPKYISSEKIAEQLSVTSRYILQLAAQGKIPSVRLGHRCVRFNIAEVAEKLGVHLE